MNTFEKIIMLLKNFWYKNNCIIMESIDLQVGAGTLHPITFFSGLNNKDISVVYVQPSRRPLDSKFTKDSYKYQYYFQFQVLIKPIPNNIKILYLKSLEYIGIKLKYNDLKFIENNWENSTLASWGIGWEIHLNGLEITQFTYFQQVGGLYCNPIMVEITYGLERVAIFVQKIKKISDIKWSLNSKIKYGDIFNINEIQYSYYYKKHANVKNIICIFNIYEKEVIKLLSLNNPLIFPAYELILKLIHNFNILDSRNILSDLEKKKYIIRIQKLSKNLANIYINIFN